MPGCAKVKVMRQDPLSRLEGIIGAIGETLARLDALLLAAAREGDMERVRAIVALQNSYYALLGQAEALVGDIREGRELAPREEAEVRRRLGYRVRVVRWTLLLPAPGAILGALLAPLLALLGRAMRPRKEPAPPPVRPVPLLIIPTTIQPTAAPNAV